MPFLCKADAQTKKSLRVLQKKMFSCGQALKDRDGHVVLLVNISKVQLEPTSAQDKNALNKHGFEFNKFIFF